MDLQVYVPKLDRRGLWHNQLFRSRLENSPVIFEPARVRKLLNPMQVSLRDVDFRHLGGIRDLAEILFYHAVPSSRWDRFWIGPQFAHFGVHLSFEECSRRNNPKLHWTRDKIEALWLTKMREWFIQDAPDRFTDESMVHEPYNGLYQTLPPVRQFGPVFQKSLACSQLTATLNASFCGRSSPAGCHWCGITPVGFSIGIAALGIDSVKIQMRQVVEVLTNGQ